MLASLTNAPLLETLVCLILVFALLSILVSTLTEIVNSYFNERGKQLYAVISRLFSDGLNVNFGQLMYSHPMIANMRKNINSFPQYISNPLFSQVLIDTISNFGLDYKYDETKKAIVLQTTLVNDKDANAAADTDTLVFDPFERFKEGVLKMKHTDLKLLLLNMIGKSESLSRDNSERLVHLDAQIQQWYGDQMDRVTGWFKDHMRFRVRLISFLVALALNANSIFLFQSLYSNPQLRSSLYPVAEAVADRYARLAADTSLTAEERAFKAWMATSLPNANTDSSLRLIQEKAAAWQRLDSQLNKQDTARLNNLQRLNDQLHKIAALGLPIGWTSNAPPLNFNANNEAATGATLTTADKLGQWLLYLLGLFITGYSISLGAPFWFDLLLKFINIRRAGKKPGDDDK
jgi:hypothetical protein